MKPSGIGGMAVIEGVMMRNKDEYAVAVRKPDNEIIVEKNVRQDFSDKVKLFKLPIFRGMLAFVDSMVIAIKILGFSASFFEEEEETSKTQKGKKQAKTKKKTNKKEAKSKTKNVKTKSKEIKENDNGNQISGLMMAAAVVVSIGMSILLFMVLPVLVSSLFSKIITNNLGILLLEGCVRILIFVGYVIAAAQMPDIKRVFMYHGAEHKTINCLENGFELTVENVKWQSKQHKRCGTSFMLLVMFISLIFFILVPVENMLLRVLTRIIFVPFIAGVSYEFIRLAGKSDNVIVNILSKPGMLMQKLTTREPEDAMIEVAIKSVEAVFDWREFLGDTTVEEKPDQLKNPRSDEEDEILSALDKYLADKNEKEGNRKVM